jgi:hypothetical protein
MIVDSNVFSAAIGFSLSDRKARLSVLELIGRRCSCQEDARRLGWKAELFRCPERYPIFDIDAEVIAPPSWRSAPPAFLPPAFRLTCLHHAPSP